MAEFAGIEFSLCLSKIEPVTNTWLLALMRECWQRGLTLGTPLADNDRSASWEDALVAECEFSLESDVTHGPLTQFIELAVQEGGNGILRASNGVTPLDMHFILHNSDDYPAGSPFSWIHLSIPPAYLHPPLPSGINITYMEAYQAFLFWCQRFCELLHPLFAFGYEPQNLLPARDDQFILFDTDPAGSQMLLAGRLPNMRYWLAGETIQYLPPRLGASFDVKQRVGYQEQHLADGGLFIVPPIPRFTYTASRGYQAVQYGDALRDKLWSHADISEPERETMFREALVYYLRADMFFQQCGDVDGIETVQAHRNTLHTALNRHSAS